MIHPLSRTFARSAGFCLALFITQAAFAQVEFSRDVRPILSRHCFKCHGPDEGQRQAGLRLDVREAALAEADSGLHAIVPGRPDESELLRRIHSEDESEIMPPPETNDSLTAEEQKILRRWIAAGAEYQPHWAFVAPRKQPLPPVSRTDWVRNPIDRFILARLEAEGLSPSPPADRYTLVRRVFLDLIGLPPTHEEADAFVQDPAPDAYERLVDRLLASPHYGERWGRRWLDLARYADTNGYEKDRPRSVWPYRDWVIGSLNADLPFDRFTIEQLAGDMLPGATPEQRIATGFHRNTMINEEGGIDPLEFRFHAVVDRVSTTATVWLGLTLGCAQCHTHKYDPIPHREYYQFMAFLNNADEPEMDVPVPEIAARRGAIEAEIARLQADLPNRFRPPARDENDAADAERPENLREGEYLEIRFQEWLAAEAEQAIRWTVLPPGGATSNLPLLTVLPDGSVLASGDQTKRDEYELTFTSAPGGMTALRLEVLPDDSLPAHGPGRAYYEGPKGDFFLSELSLSADGQPVKLAGATQTYAKLSIGGGETSAALALDGQQHSGWSTAGREGEPHNAVFNLAEPLPAAEALSLHLLFDRHYPAGLGRFRVSVTDDPRARQARDVPSEIEELLLVPSAEHTPENRERLLRYFLTIAPELKAERGAIQTLRDSLPKFPTTLAFAERPTANPRRTSMHHRGEFLQPTEAVGPATLSMLHPFPEDVPRNRLEFARWLVAPGNPLVGRVTVNRHWSGFFGRGLVRTSEDFGFQGELPSHPDLLDWLALELVRQEWSIKRLHRLIVTSATYQQGSGAERRSAEPGTRSAEREEQVSAASSAPRSAFPVPSSSDPQNVLLARGPRFRLEAELIRDSVLKASDLLSTKVGGASVFPPQPASVTTEGAYGKLEWKVSPGEDRYRRGLYTFIKRTAPYAMLQTFDAPSGEACLPRREVSNTPLQALTLLNDEVFLDAARALGRRAAADEGDDEQKMQALFRRCLTRPATDDELHELLAFHEAQRHRIDRGELDATAIAGPGEADAAERAVWTITARVLLNLDETITKR